MSREHLVPDWLVERACVDELPRVLRPELRAALDGPELAARRAELAQSSAEILAALPPAGVAIEVGRRAAIAGRAHARTRTARIAALSAAVVACAVLLFVFFPGQGAVPSEPDDGDTRAKGEARLIVHRKRGDLVERLSRDGAVARAGDRLQLAYVGGNARHGVVLSIDGSGVVTLHFPEAPTGSTALASAAAPVPLAHSYELDEAPDFERFLFVTSARPIDVAALLASAEALGRAPERARVDPLPLFPAQAQWSILVRKEVSP